MLALVVASVLVLGLVGWLLATPRDSLDPAAMRPQPTQSAPAEDSADEVGLSLPREPNVVVLGDSWSAGVGATPGKDWVSRASARLNWTTGVVPGGATTGYLTAGVINAGTYLQRLRQLPRDRDVDLVVIQGGLVDVKVEDADSMRFNQAVRRVLRVAKRTYPDAERLVIGPLNPYSPNPGAIEALDSRIGFEADEAGVPYISPTQGQWFGASVDLLDDFLAGTTAGDPNNKGHRRFANRVADEVERLAAIESDRGQ